MKKWTHITTSKGSWRTKAYKETRVSLCRRGIYTTFALQSRTNLTCGTIESTPYFTTKAPKASSRVNEGWNNWIPVTNPRPQPDWAAAFGRSAFSDDQLSKLGHSLSDPAYLSRFMAIYYMRFPFLICEVKCGTTGLDIADWQNGHSMAVAVRGIVELFKFGKKESKLHGERLTFSISHDHRTVRLYGYYPIINGGKINIYRHLIHTSDITAIDGKEKWTT